MGDFFVKQAEDCIEFDDGWKVYIKQEMNAGDQEALDDFMLDARLKGNDADVRMRMGNIKLLELNILRFVGPDGTEYPAKPELVKSMARDRFKRLVAEVTKRNPPLGKKE